MLMRSSDSGAARTPMRGRYLVRNPLLYAWLAANDLAYLIYGAGRRADDRLPVQPKRVLVCIGGHRGDTVIATALFASLQQAVPGAELGVLTGSWNVPVLEGHPRLKRIHVLDRLRWNRSASQLQRFFVSRRTKRTALREIRGAGYDAALDLSPYYPNFAKVLHAAQIPVRVGFSSGGFGSLYTRSVPWSPGKHVTEDHFKLLREIAPSWAGRPGPYDLPGRSADVATLARLAKLGIAKAEYTVVHMGAGNERKEWPLAKWKAVVAQLDGAGMPIVITGAGPRQERLAEDLRSAVPHVINLCDVLSWSEFRSVIGNAKQVLTVDTITLHIAAAEGTPCISLMAGMDNPDRWLPMYGSIRSLTKAVPCAPCYLSRGCGGMECIRDIEPESVVNAALNAVQAAAVV